tara:strand:- start:48660 stop:49595 length:936 start_codon:yes stop_codon:yes gene_type:complete
MKLRKIIVPVFVILIGFTACKKDDANDVEITPPRDRGEQQIADDVAIVDYLESHYYNASFFEGNTNPKISDIIITNSASSGSALLMDAVETKTTVYANISYKYYILKLNQGGGTGSPSFADDIRVVYEGFLADGTVFDDNAIVPSNFDLITDVAVSGWRRVFPEFNVAENFVENNDGTTDYVNSGVGIMFLPSGLSYFSTSPSSKVPAYSPLFFKFELLDYSENDHDNDGIPSYLEDVNGDGNFTIEDPEDKTITHDDTDGDGTPNAFDADDDGDGVPTIREDIDKDGDPTNDIGKNGIAKYLDPEETEAN